MIPPSSPQVEPTGAGRTMAILALPSFARIMRTRITWAFVAGWFAIALAVALRARAHGAPHGADHALVDVVGSVILPLLAYLLVGAATGAASMSESVSPLVAFGARPTSAGLACVGVAALACSLSGAALAGSTAVVAHGIGDPPILRDAVASVYAGALGGAAYACWFSCGATFGRRGGGRALLLVVDWVLGDGDGAAALVTPRAHLRNLLGGSPPVDLSQRESAVALAAIATLALLATLWRIERRSLL